MPQMLAVGAAVDTRYPAKDGYGMLTGQDINDIPSLPECGLKIAIAFLG